MALIGFARVSTLGQDLSEQQKALSDYGCEKIFVGKNSGKAESNEARLKELLDYVREGDVVVVTKLDRLGRSLKQVLSVLDEFKVRNVGFKTLDNAIDTTKTESPISVAMIQLLGLFAELERNFIITRTKEGKIAKGEAAKGGRSCMLSDLKNFKKDVEKGVSLTELSAKYSISRSTAQRYKKKVGK